MAYVLQQLVFLGVLEDRYIVSVPLLHGTAKLQQSQGQLSVVLGCVSLDQVLPASTLPNIYLK